MTQKNLIAANDICRYHNVDSVFIGLLEQAGLVEIKVVNKITYIPESELQKLERMIRMHHELEINIAGIEAISHLLQRVEQMQEEMRILRNKMIRN